MLTAACLLTQQMELTMRSILPQQLVARLSWSTSQLQLAARARAPSAMAALKTNGATTLGLRSVSAHLPRSGMV